ncbi:hypothetical protein MHBO_000847 [Bonamia ostreae]|uniref:Adenylate cyclase-associated CAP C-terminal domain-containing protein n=1 Tax=Bonamia ostreae TaxID=126728 RepID=A0ABV2AH01_9EUKA
MTSKDKCENVKITVESLISSLELMNSKNVKVGVTDSVKHFQVDKCSDVTLNVKNHEGVMITHTGCKNFNLEMNGKSLKLPSSFVSTFSKGKFDHVIATNDKCCA